jgi:hypothetical protein
MAYFDFDVFVSSTSALIRSFQFPLGFLDRDPGRKGCGGVEMLLKVAEYLG